MGKLTCVLSVLALTQTFNVRDTDYNLTFFKLRSKTDMEKFNDSRMRTVMDMVRQEESLALQLRHQTENMKIGSSGAE